MNRFAGRRAMFVFALLALVLAAAQAAQAVQVGTIVLTNGERFENVEYGVDRVYSVVRFRWNGEVKVVSIHQVHRIYEPGETEAQSLDSSGVAELGSELEPWRSESDPFVQSERRARWKLRLGGHGSYCLLAGSYYDYLNGGAGFGGHVAVAVTRNIAIRALVDYSSIKLESGVQFYSNDPQVSIVDQNTEFSLMRFHIAAEYYGYLNPSGNGSSMYYLYSGLGAVKHSSSANVTVRDNSSGTESSARGLFSETRFAFCSGIGLIGMFSPVIGIDGGIHMDMVTYEGETSSGTPAVGYAYTFVFRLGLVWVI